VPSAEPRKSNGAPTVTIPNRQLQVLAPRAMLGSLEDHHENRRADKGDDYEQL
jgi:hypothetical protein